VDADGDDGAAPVRESEFMSLRLMTVLVMLPALSPAAVAHARPLTTTPQYVVDIHVTITDARIVLDPRSAPRGAEGRFIITNAGASTHNFTLKGRRGPADAGFSRTLKPHQRAIVRLSLNVRGTVAYFDGLPVDRGKPGMSGTFVII
jgi:hypothetical protein